MQVLNMQGHSYFRSLAQWAGSCWYYLRYIDPRNHAALVDAEAERYWMPVDLYVGGAEHAVLHLLYARFWHKVRSAASRVGFRRLSPRTPRADRVFALHE